MSLGIAYMEQRGFKPGEDYGFPVRWSPGFQVEYDEPVYNVFSVPGSVNSTGTATTNAVSGSSGTGGTGGIKPAPEVVPQYQTPIAGLKPRPVFVGPPLIDPQQVQPVQPVPVVDENGNVYQTMAQTTGAKDPLDAAATVGTWAWILGGVALLWFLSGKK